MSHHFSDSSLTTEETVDFLSFRLQGFDIDNDPFVIPAETAFYSSPSFPNQRSFRKAYVVFHGRRMGVFSTWPACGAQVNGFSHNNYKGYDSVAEAREAWNHALRHGIWGLNGSGLCLDRVPEFDVHILCNELVPVYQNHGVHALNLHFHPRAYPVPPNDVSSPSVFTTASSYMTFTGTDAGLSPDEELGVSVASPATSTRQGSRSYGGRVNISPQVHTSRAKGKNVEPSSSKKVSGTAARISGVVRKVVAPAKILLTYLNYRHRSVYGQASFGGGDGPWKVVVRGFAPGLYFGSEEANRGLGDCPAPLVKSFETCEQAEAYLGYVFMSCLMVEYDEEGAPHRIGCRFSRNAAN